MSRQARARRVAQRLRFDPRHIRRLRWIAKARAVASVGARIGPNLAFVLLDPEPHNYTYELANYDELAGWISDVTGAGAVQAQALLDEARADPGLAARIRAATARHPLWAKASPPLGKRLAWYALVRWCRPELVVETGVHDGLGSAVLLGALARNAAEGAPGRLVSFDVNPAAGWIVGSDPSWELRIQPSRDGLGEVLARRGPVGLFIHDSLHSYENEHFELSSAAAALAPGGVLVSDNAHATTALADVCEEHGLRCLVFHERPARHFYPGGAMGAGVAERAHTAPDP
jgi:predicted O-methyltransferase YrrM